ncbi:MAG: hypothetical protein QXD94_06420 [Sulfolobales archaeon]
MFDLLLATINTVYSLKNVKVVVLKDLGKLPINGEVTTVSRGQEIDLPRWLANALSELGATEIKYHPTTPDDVGKYLISEKSMGKSSLAKLREDFYRDVKDLLSRVKSSSIDADSAIAAIRLESNLRDLIRLRMNKIVSIATLNARLEKLEENLTIEELLLFKLLNDLLSSWLNQLAPEVFKSER